MSQLENISRYTHLHQQQGEVTNVHHAGYVASNMNPIRRDTVRTLLNVDTLFARSRELVGFEPQNFLYELPYALSNVISLKLTSVEVPSVWHNISTLLGNNSVRIDVSNYSDGAGGFLDSSNVITLPDGDYTAEQFTAYMNNYFFNTKNGLDFLRVEVSDVDGKTTIRAVDPTDGAPAGTPAPFDVSGAYYSPDLAITLYFNYSNGEYFDPNTVDDGFMVLQQTLGWHMGFDMLNYSADASATTVDAFSAAGGAPVTFRNTLTGSRIYGNSMHRYFYVDVDDFQRNTGDVVVANVGMNLNSISKNVIARIPISTAHNTLFFGNNQDYVFKTRIYHGPVRLQRMRIRILDSFGREMPVSNDFSLTFEVESVYS
jgi:hypothetical protein